MREDDRFGEGMRELVREIDPVPAVPREEMWLRIRQQRALQSAPAAVVALRPRPWRMWAQWSAALAAMLLVGIGLGRLSVLRQAEPLPQQPAVAETSQPARADVPSPYRFATAQHLQRTENLLTTVLIEAHRRPVEEMAAWARDLRTETRLLLSSPAAADPVTRLLLEDLELLLSQIVVIPADRQREEVERIQERINQGDVLLRIRAATATRTVVGT